MLPSSRTYAFWLALLRITTGAFWLMHAVPKFWESATFMPPNGFAVDFVGKAIANTSGPYHDFLLNTVQPHIDLFAELIRFGEAITGILLVLGLLTRLGGLGGMILTLNYMTCKGLLFSTDGWSGLDGAMFALSGINLFVPAGRMLGIDALMGRRRAQSKAVEPEFVDEKPMTGPTAPTE
jgi:uncharacterized membrane protein YphA (DoxX/SURF4 family)